LKVWIVFDEEEQEGGYVRPYRTIKAVVDSEEKMKKLVFGYDGKWLPDIDYEECEVE